MMYSELLIQLWKQLDRSTIVLIILTLISMLVIALQHKRILPSPYFNYQDSSTKDKMAKCRECSKLKPISQLKICSNCKCITTTHSSIDLNFYYCDRICQKLNWKAHKLTCGHFKNLESTSIRPTDPSNTSVSSHTPSILPPSNLFNLNSDNRRTEIEGSLKKWCEFHQSLLIFATMHGLDLIRYPHNSTQFFLMVSLNVNEKEDEDTRISRLKPSKPDESIDDSNIHKLFSVAYVGSLDSINFLNLNPGMINGFQKIDKFRAGAKAQGGTGAAILLVCLGAVGHIIPVGLPPKADLDKVPYQPNWRHIFDDAIKTGLPWKPSASR